MTSTLITLARAFQRKKKLLFSADIEVQQKFIKKLGVPRDDIERGYFQYRCQMKLLGRSLAFLYNITSMPLMLLYKKRAAHACTPKAEGGFDAVFMYNGTDTILPQSVKENNSVRQVKDFQKKLLLTEEDIVFLKDLRKWYPFAWHFRFKCLMKVAIYSFQITSFQPKALIVSSEYSFTSSVLTAYCEYAGVRHINVMHGEKLYYMRDSFFRFHECYVWDEHYKSLFSDLKAEPTQFIIAVPPSLAPWGNTDVSKTVDYTYYLGAEQCRETFRIKRSLDLLIKYGNRVAIRPHPVYSAVDEIQSVFGGDDNYIIEDSALPIEISVLRTRYAVSCYSTVLVQAINNGVVAVIDDVTNKGKYEKLKRLRYICMEKEHFLLSDMVKSDIEFLR